MSVRRSFASAPVGVSMRVPSAVPSLQNVRNMQTPTAASAERESFSIVFSLGTVESNKLPRPVQHLLLGTVRGEDLVLAIKVAGLPVPEDREQIAGVCYDKMQQYFTKLNILTEEGTNLLFSHTNVYTNTSTCSQKASKTYYYWATANDDQKNNMKEMLAKVGGLKKLAETAFGLPEMQIPERSPKRGAGQEEIPSSMYTIAFDGLASSTVINLSGNFSTPSSATFTMRRTAVNIQGSDQGAASSGGKRKKV